MSWFKQPRILALSGEALPTYRGEDLLTVTRVSGAEKIGKLYRCTAEVATLDAQGLHASEAQKLVDSAEKAPSTAPSRANSSAHSRHAVHPSPPPRRRRR